MTSFPTDSKVVQIRQPAKAEPSIINEKTIADFARVAEIAGILRLAGSRPASGSSD
jgi:hypothetical protein